MDRLEQLLQEYRVARNKRLDADHEAKKLADEEDRLERECMALMEARNITSLKHEGVGYAFVQKVYGKIEDFDVAKTYVQEAMIDDIMLQEKFVKTEVDKIVRKSLEETGDIPPGFSFSVKKYISVTGG